MANLESQSVFSRHCGAMGESMQKRDMGRFVLRKTPQTTVVRAGMEESGLWQLRGGAWSVREGFP